MPQVHFPIFPSGATAITPDLYFCKEDGNIVYFNWNMPVFMHPEDDIRTFRMYTSQLCVHGHAKQADIIRAFGVTKNSVLRGVRLFREKGPAGFYEKKKGRGAGVLTEEVLLQAQELLDEGKEPSEAARELGIKPNTLSKALRDGRLHAVKKNI